MRFSELVDVAHRQEDGGSGFAGLWRFASVVAQTLGVWVNVSPDAAAAAAVRTEADPL